MVVLRNVVNELKDTLKEVYLRDQKAVWQTPFVGFISRGDVSFIRDQVSDRELVTFLQHFRNKQKLDGVVVGRMAAKYSDTIKDVDGSPMILERAIIVSGRMLSTGETYVVIVPCRQYQDMRVTESGDPSANRPFVPGVDSPDKVIRLTNEETGAPMGFLELQFGEEQVFDSRMGQRCELDPIIAGVTGNLTA